MFYNTLGNPAFGSNTNTGAFSNLSSYYWTTDTLYWPLNVGIAWYFNFLDGESRYMTTSNELGAWVVHDGDVGAVVPVPAAIWLFGSGLLGLIGITRRK